MPGAFSACLLTKEVIKKEVRKDINQVLSRLSPRRIAAEWKQSAREWELARSYWNRWVAGEIDYGKIVDEVEQLASEELKTKRVLHKIDILDGSYSE